MKKLFFLLLVSFSLSSVCLDAKKIARPTVQSLVVESKAMLDILDHVTPRSLVVWDLDAVIMEPVQMLGNDSWAYYEGDKYIDRCGDVKKGLDAFWPTWFRVQEKVTVKLVEKSFLDVYKKIALRNAKNIGFTARGIPLVERTKVQLSSIGVDLEKNNWSSKKEVSSDLFSFKHGTLFGAIGCDKGACLKSFFNKIKQQPIKIVFIDDRTKNIVSLQKMCREERIPFVGIRYGGADESIKNFRKDIVDTQLHILNKFDRVISDKKAEKMLSFFSDILKKKDGATIKKIGTSDEKHA
ncbi:DUF2608 domain-containing protein [Candidatus Babeliales bacterium]|nr:DUF2608 domain-containing protein [Candidatus Babeliales bacterium]